MALDLKYGVVTMGKDSEHNPLNGSDEPVFVIRASDLAAVDAIIRYIDCANRINAPNSLVELAWEDTRRFKEWQASHPERVKVPD